MSAGWVLVQTQQGAAADVAGTLASLPGVESAEPTAGAYDVVARVADAGPTVPSARRVVKAALRVPGVTLAVCCHDNSEAERSEAERSEAIDLTDRTIDLTTAGSAAPTR